MRWRLTLLVAATTAAVVLAFLVPLALLLRSLAAERTLTTVTSQAQNLAAVAAASGPQAARAALARQRPDAVGTTTVSLPDGTLVGDPVTDPAVPGVRARGVPQTDRTDGRTVVYATAAGSSGVTVVRSEVTDAQLHSGVDRVVWILAGLGLLMLALSVAAADTLARRVSAPIRDLAAAADSLHEGLLETRTAERGPPEVMAMARALNRLAARIEQLLISERETVADLSHRLRTPVTALRLDAEAIGDPELAGRLEEHVAHLERTVDAVVRDARRPVRASVTARCDVAGVVYERVAFWSALADEQGRSLRIRLPEHPVWARIDSVDLTDLVDVLIDNVFAHTEEGVPLQVSVSQAPSREITLSVQDGGPGLPGADVVTRGHSLAGSSGLGLDIVRRAAIASGGRLELGRSRLGGAKVQVVLAPADDPAGYRVRVRQRPRATRGWGGRLRRLAGGRPGGGRSGGSGAPGGAIQQGVARTEPIPTRSRADTRRVG